MIGALCEHCAGVINGNHHRVTVDDVLHYFHDTCGAAARALYHKHRGAAVRFTYSRPPGHPRHPKGDGRGPQGGVKP